MGNKTEAIISIFFPLHCPFCDTVIDYKSLYCDECEKSLLFTSLHSVCTRCGKAECVCGREPFLDRIYVPFFYYEKIKNAIKGIKFHNKRGYARPLAKILSAFILKADPNATFDLIIPVPMTKKDVRKRGYNQSALIAKFLAKNLLVEVDNKSLIKTRQTKKQHELENSKNRKTNLKDAFSVINPDKLKGKTVLLCDDVITTGSTLKEISSVLKKAGVLSIKAAVLATSAGIENS